MKDKDKQTLKRKDKTNIYYIRCPPEKEKNYPAREYFALRTVNGKQILPSLMQVEKQSGIKSTKQSFAKRLRFFDRIESSRLEKS